MQTQKVWPTENLTIGIYTDGKHCVTDQETFETLQSLKTGSEPSVAFMAVFLLGLHTGRIREVETA